MKRGPVLLAWVGFVLACSRTDIDDNGGILSTSSGGGPLDICDPAGVRICGAGCPELLTPDADTIAADAAGYCPGYGCLPAEDIHDFSDAAAGVCVADTKDTAKYACGTCNDGEVCLQQSKDKLVCVPEDVCRALWKLGVRDVCRYADFSPYDDRPLPSPSGCPLTDGSGLICSGGCPSCSPLARCVGRSPDHPFGVCNTTTAVSPQPSDFLHCPSCFQVQPGFTTWACAVFDGAPTDAALARSGGFCMDQGQCLKMGKALPGGLSCYDAAGNRIGP